MYGEIKYFVPEWGATLQNDSNDIFRAMSIEEV
jgi:hypothetical protein